MKLKPWYEVVKPREDLREGKSQDASEFAVHLDRVRDKTGRPDYINPERFFAKTFLAANLLDLSAQVVRRMAGETSYTSPVFNLATNFGGGKTHALTLLYNWRQWVS
jgi:predicted AAA+ superfamily ATPase